MMKVVINDQYGGFSLSPEGETAYLARKGKTPFFYVAGERGTRESYRRWVRGEAYFVIYTVLEDVGDEPTSEKMNAAEWFNDRSVDRSDPDLVAVVEELGKRAGGSHATLKIVEVPDDVEWEIEEYDGLEWVAEKHRVWR